MATVSEMIVPASASSPRVRRGFGEWVRSRTGKRTLVFYTFTAPLWLGFILLGLIPMLLGVAVSFTNYDGLNLFSGMRFVGVRNYERILSDPVALESIPRTLLWAAISVPVGLMAAFILAVILNQDIRGRGVFRTIFYLPSIMPMVAVTVVWRIFLDGNYGLLNYLLGFIWPNIVIHWFTDQAFVSLLVLSVWWGMGGGMVLLLAGLQGIPEELKEAARMDGANSWQVFWGVTFPMMTPVIFFQVIIGIIGSLQSFIIPILLGTQNYATVGAARPPDEVYFFMVRVWQLLYVEQSYGRSTAMLWVLAVIIGLLTLLVFRSSRLWVFEGEAAEGK
jgi:multiple sugar transport system permease protein